MDCRLLKPLLPACLALVAIGATRALAADTATAVINDIRTRGCPDRPGAVTMLERSPALDDIARTWSQGGTLQQSFERSHYHSLGSVSKHIGGIDRESDVAYVLKEEYCNVVTNRAFSQMGLFRQGKHLWMVLATPFMPPEEADTRQRTLLLVNDARTRTRYCGEQKFRATHALTLAPELERAAERHARDMAAHDTLAHHGSDGTTVAPRVTETGYRWSIVGENLSSGATNADAAVAGWLASPTHCANLMNPEFREMGIAYMFDPLTRPGIYWVQVLAAPAAPEPPKPKPKPPRGRAH